MEFSSWSYRHFPDRCMRYAEETNFTEKKKNTQQKLEKSAFSHAMLCVLFDVF